MRLCLSTDSTFTILTPQFFKQAIDREVEITPCKKSIAMAAFATALRQMPAIIADNGGYDSAELVT